MVPRLRILLAAAFIFCATESFAAEMASEVHPDGETSTQEAASDEALLIHALSELKRWTTQVEVLSNKLAAKRKLLQKQNAAAAEQIKIHKAAAEQSRIDAASAEQSKSSASSDKLADDIVASTGIPPNICASGGIPLVGYHNKTIYMCVHARI